MPVKLRPQRRDQGADLGVDRADSAEMLVVLGDFQQALARDVPAPGHIFEERHDIVRLFGTAEADDEDGVMGRVGRGRGVSLIIGNSL